MLLGRVLGHDVAGKGGGRGQSPPPPPTLSRPRRPKEEDRGAVQPLASSLLTPSRVTGTAGTTTKTGLCLGGKRAALVRISVRSLAPTLAAVGLQLPAPEAATAAAGRGSRTVEES